MTCATMMLSAVSGMDVAHQCMSNPNKPLCITASTWKASTEGPDTDTRRQD